MNFLNKLFSFFKTEKKIKLGLALGSGGAKGFAELGAIRAFEENGIEFDVIAGTSIGSVVGAFYANGYSSTDILELIKRMNFLEILSAPFIGMDTSGMRSVIDNQIGYLEFEDLKKNFKAVATEMDTGNEKVFDSGSVADALCASSCMVPFFKPVVIDGKRYIDGAFVNSVPADIVKGMGADYIVGIDLKDHEAKPSVITRFFPTYKGKVEKPWENGYKYSDIVLHPDLSGYKAESINGSGVMYERGYECAMQNMDRIKSDIEKLKKGKK